MDNINTEAGNINSLTVPDGLNDIQAMSEIMKILEGRSQDSKIRILKGVVHYYDLSEDME